MDVGQSKIVWSGNNGCHVSQDDVIKLWVALCPSFPDSYGILRFHEQENFTVGLLYERCHLLRQHIYFVRKYCKLVQSHSTETDEPCRYVELNASYVITASTNGIANQTTAEFSFKLFERLCWSVDFICFHRSIISGAQLEIDAATCYRVLSHNEDLLFDFRETESRCWGKFANGSVCIEKQVNSIVTKIRKTCGYSVILNKDLIESQLESSKNMRLVHRTVTRISMSLTNVGKVFSSNSTTFAFQIFAAENNLANNIFASSSRRAVTDFVPVTFALEGGYQRSFSFGERLTFTNIEFEILPLSKELCETVEYICVAVVVESTKNVDRNHAITSDAVCIPASREIISCSCASVDFRVDSFSVDKWVVIPSNTEVNFEATVDVLISFDPLTPHNPSPNFTLTFSVTENINGVHSVACHYVIKEQNPGLNIETSNADSSCGQMFSTVYIKGYFFVPEMNDSSTHQCNNTQKCQFSSGIKTVTLSIFPEDLIPERNKTDNFGMSKILIIGRDDALSELDAEIHHVNLNRGFAVDVAASMIFAGSHEISINAGSHALLPTLALVRQSDRDLSADVTTSNSVVQTITKFQCHLCIEDFHYLTPGQRMLVSYRFYFQPEQQMDACSKPLYWLLSFQLSDIYNLSDAIPQNNQILLPTKFYSCSGLKSNLEIDLLLARTAPLSASILFPNLPRFLVADGETVSALSARVNLRVLPLYETRLRDLYEQSRAPGDDAAQFQLAVKLQRCSAYDTCPVLSLFNITLSRSSDDLILKNVGILETVTNRIRLHRNHKENCGWTSLSWSFSEVSKSSRPVAFSILPNNIQQHDHAIYIVCTHDQPSVVNFRQIWPVVFDYHWIYNSNSVSAFTHFGTSFIFSDMTSCSDHPQLSVSLCADHHCHGVDSDDFSFKLMNCSADVDPLPRFSLFRTNLAARHYQVTVKGIFAITSLTFQEVSDVFSLFVSCDRINWVLAGDLFLPFDNTPPRRDVSSSPFVITNFKLVEGHLKRTVEGKIFWFAHAIPGVIKLKRSSVFRKEND